MFSVDNFYYILYENLLKKANFTAYYFYPFGSTKTENIVFHPEFNSPLTSNYFFAYDQEPIIKELPNYNYWFEDRCKILGNSEHSELKNQLCKEKNWIDFYYFYHGFAALYWFNDWQYFQNVDKNFSYPFISLNRLTTNDRSYRLLLVAKMLECNILENGLVSLSLRDHGYGNWQSELSDPNTKLTKKQIAVIEQQFSKINYQSLVVDNVNPQGFLSASNGLKDLELNQKALWHVVSETVFYHKKQHLTEKIFKPIASRRPFILVAAPGNLAYLKSYGFKTFDKWIDESYDSEIDDDLRLGKIIKELEKIANMPMYDLRLMHKDMQEILNYNFNHFYNDFKKIIINELLQNFQLAISTWNDNKNKKYSIMLDKIDFYKIFADLSV